MPKINWPDLTFPPINLWSVWPMPNLCDLPQHEQAAIEADKDRWFQCHKMLYGVKGFNGEMKHEAWPRREIERFIRQQPEHEQQDWRDRLNTMRNNRADRDTNASE